MPSLVPRDRKILSKYRAYHMYSNSPLNSGAPSILKGGQARLQRRKPGITIGIEAEPEHTQLIVFKKAFWSEQSEETSE